MAPLCVFAFHLHCLFSLWSILPLLSKSLHPSAVPFPPTLTLSLSSYFPFNYFPFFFFPIQFFPPLYSLSAAIYFCPNQMTGIQGKWKFIAYFELSILQKKSEMLISKLIAVFLILMVHLSERQIVSHGLGTGR